MELVGTTGLATKRNPAANLQRSDTLVIALKIA
jgi:hypothetical protein